MYSTSALAATILCIYTLSLTHALPVTELQSRQTDDECSAGGEVYRSSCWDKYDLLNWVLQWNATYSKTTCGTVEDPLDCETHKTCLADEPWSTCFLRLAENHAGQSCTSLDGEGCDKNSKLDDALDPSIRAQVRYVARSIYMVESFFGSYFTALGNAVTNVNLIIGSITRAIDPKQNTALSLTSVLTALTVGLSFLTAPALGAAAISSVEHAGLQKAASVWATSLAQAPGVAKSIWPQGDEASISWQINQLQSDVKTITDGYMNMLDNGLKDIMLDPNEFVHFADHGVFAVNNPLDAIDSLNATALALQTYLVSESLGQNAWYITPGKTSTKDEFDQDFPLKPPCAPGPMGRCIQGKSLRPEWYWSPTTTRRYHFQVMSNDAVTPLSPEDMMATIVSNNWTTLDILFDGAYDCVLNGNYDTGQVLKIDPTTNAIDTTCISHLPMKSKCGQGCALELPGGQACPIDDDCDYSDCAAIHGGMGCGITASSGPQMGNSTLVAPAKPETSSSSSGEKPCIAVPSHGGNNFCKPGTGPGSGSTATS